MYIVIIVLIWALYEEYKRNLEIKEYWEQWDSESFEFNNARYSRKFFRLVDSKVEKRN